jgi:hypothetical protein
LFEEEAQKAVKEREEKLKAELKEVMKVLAELKVELLQHFGDAIALDGHNPKK